MTEGEIPAVSRCADSLRDRWGIWVHLSHIQVFSNDLTGGKTTAVMVSGELQSYLRVALPRGTDSCWSTAFLPLLGSRAGSEWCCCPAQPLVHSSSHQELVQLLGRDWNPTIASLGKILKLCVRNIKDSIAPISRLFLGNRSNCVLETKKQKFLKTKITKWKFHCSFLKSFLLSFLQSWCL